MSKPIDLRRSKLIGLDQVVIPDKYFDELKGILIPEGYLNDRIARLGQEISNQPYTSPLLAICILDGAMGFFTKLVSAIEHPVEIDTTKSKSYNGSRSSGEANFIGLDVGKIPGRHVLVVEDIIDTGSTLEYTVNLIQQYNPLSVSIAALLDKPAQRKPDCKIKPQYVGFRIPNVFVVGAFLDYNNRYRDLSHLAVLKDELIPKS